MKDFILITKIGKNQTIMASHDLYSHLNNHLKCRRWGIQHGVQGQKGLGWVAIRPQKGEKAAGLMTILVQVKMGALSEKEKGNALNEVRILASIK